MPNVDDEGSGDDSRQCDARQRFGLQRCKTTEREERHISSFLFGKGIDERVIPTVGEGNRVAFKCRNGGATACQGTVPPSLSLRRDK
jgi:hypothetical protein